MKCIIYKEKNPNDIYQILHLGFLIAQKQLKVYDKIMFIIKENRINEKKDTPV